jgi:acylphosphatase
MKHAAITVTGRVQGVWFRRYTLDRARELGLKGFVRNQPDGSVFIRTSGPDEKVDALIAWCWQGSPLSHVEEVLVEESATPQEIPFTIKS